jgi:hypothetical protein
MPSAELVAAAQRLVDTWEMSADSLGAEWIAMGERVQALHSALTTFSALRRCDALAPGRMLRCDLPPGHSLPHASVHGAEWNQTEIGRPRSSGRPQNDEGIPL